MVTTFEGDSAVIDNNAAAPVKSDAARLSHTNRFCGRTHHSAGSQYWRYSSSAVIITRAAGATRAARFKARCSSVERSPRREYCAGAGDSSTFAVGAHSGPWSSATTMHQCVFGKPSDVKRAPGGGPY